MSRSRTAAAVAALTPVLVIAGCKLIDQTTFAPAPATGPTFTAPAPELEARRPLMTIDLGTKLPEYRTILRYGVHEAQLRRPDVQFDVVSVVPDTGTPEHQVQTAASAQGFAASVMRDIMAEGVPAERIRLSARTSPKIGQSQIRVYVR